MMSLNRYRLRHLTKSGHRGAARAHRLLERPDQLIGVILIGNNFVNILASAIATVIATRLWGDAGIAIATALLTMIILIFAEVTPKTLAAIYPEKIAFPASLILIPLLKLIYPIVWIVNLISNNLLKLLGHKELVSNSDHLSREELRTLVHESGTRIPIRHRRMLLSILDLGKVTVEDIMVPRSEISGIDIEDEIEQIVAQLKTSQHTRLPIYKGDINNIIGMLHLRNVAKFVNNETVNKAALLQCCRDPYFIPEGTTLNTQLLNFQKVKRRIGIVVDEYGDVVGLAALEDILEEIVGEFTTDIATTSPDITPLDDGAFLINGSATIRTINRVLDWKLPTDGPKTLNGLILEALEAIPEYPVGLQLFGYNVEIKQIKDNVVKAAVVVAPASLSSDKARS
jgi:Mg2+/Co2+ transporter CorB